ncbi:hypothetical protein AMJ85_04255 [candidate division BRC1 bacterium SM23_51]|nr:MAG: hypothetical protein AMJ85_04255 [candidate division BRC1 bacterium SM23_51]
MEQRRFLLFIAVTGIAYALFFVFVWGPYQKQLNEYRKAHPEEFGRRDTTTTSPLTAAAATTPTLRTELEPTTATRPAEQPPTIAAAESKATTIAVQTNLYRVVLTSRGGRPTSWRYFDRVPGRAGVEPIEMIPRRDDLAERERELPLEVVFKESNRVEYPEFNTSVYEHQITVSDDGSTRIVFVSPEVRQLQLVKTYQFRPDDYLTSFQVVLRNLGEKAPCQVNDDERGLGIAWGPGVRQFQPKGRADLRYVNTVYGTAARVGHAKPTKSGDEKQYRGEVQWAGVTDKFFLAAVIPDRTKAAAVHSLLRLKNLYPQEKGRRGGASHAPPFTVVLYNDKFAVAPRHQVALDYQIFVGPKRPALLREVGQKVDRDLSSVLFYLSMFRWMRALKLGLMHALNFLHSLVGSYGMAIVILTILIRIVTHPIAHKGMKMQAKTMAEMQKIKPLLDEVNKKYKGDAAKRNQEMMRLYKEHGISPLAPLRGCLPMLIQIPVFFALYSLLNQSIDLRGASFLWIDDLSGPDKLVDLTQYGLAFSIPIVGWRVTSVNLLPILMGVSQHFMSKLTPTPTRDASQKQMMMMFAIFFPVLLYNFPSGLFIYWLINNVWQSTHQLIANRIVRKKPEGKAAAAKA